MEIKSYGKNPDELNSVDDCLSNGCGRADGCGWGMGDGWGWGHPLDSGDGNGEGNGRGSGIGDGWGDGRGIGIGFAYSRIDIRQNGDGIAKAY